jgi:hypothetical protein
MSVHRQCEAKQLPRFAGADFVSRARGQHSRRRPSARYFRLGALQGRAADMPVGMQHKLRGPHGNAISQRGARTPQYVLDHIVYVVDDDPRVRQALGDLLAACGYNAQMVACAEEFIATADQWCARSRSPPHRHAPERSPTKIGTPTFVLPSAPC